MPAPLSLLAEYYLLQADFARGGRVKSREQRAKSKEQRAESSGEYGTLCP
jgi:hypothetical protein